jgi:hypothetical protein
MDARLPLLPLTMDYVPFEAFATEKRREHFASLM